jgi:hypothetical protein
LFACSASPDARDPDDARVEEQVPVAIESSQSFVRGLQATHAELRIERATGGSLQTAEHLQDRAKAVAGEVASARERCHEVNLGWLAIDVDVVSGSCSPDCVAASFVRDSWLRFNLQNSVRQVYHEDYSLERDLHEPESLRATYVVGVSFASNGESSDSTVSIDSKNDPGELELGGWMGRLAEKARLGPVESECRVRASFRVNAAHFAEPY